MSLKQYQEKRKFEETPEPAGAEQPSEGPLRFVVHKHKARRLHYDLRLEFGRALKSWAVPKGPSLNPGDKRLAVMVEDHPLDYRTFEGVIPADNYGAGPVMVWDEGEYDAPGAASREMAEQILTHGLEKGHLTFILKGKKLRGEFALVKFRSKEPNQWLLIKANDRFAGEQDILEEDRSVLTSRTMEEIAAESSAPAAPDIDLSGAPPGPMPRDVKPMLATPMDDPFDKTGWLFEIKWDGYRAIAEIERGAVRLYSRHTLPLNDHYPEIVESLSRLGTDAVMDGEVVVLDEKGVPHFEMLQNYRGLRKGTLVYYVFDLLWLDGRDLRNLPLIRRKEILAAILPSLPHVRFADHVPDKGRAFFEMAAAKGLEGVLAKDGQSPYRTGMRGREWLKVKARQRREAVIGGFTEPRGGRQYLGALILGAYKDDELVYIGHTGGGSDDKVLAELRLRLDPLVREGPPFKNPPKRNAPAHWVEPRLVCEVEFAEWTDDGKMRQPIFLRLHEHKSARNARLEEVEKPRAPDPNPFAGKQEARVTANGRTLRLTNLNKIFWPREKYTKGDLIAYYRDVAGFILPHLRDRPQSLNRHPDGIEGPSFYQKDVKDAPEWAETVRIRTETEDREITYLLCQDEPTLIYMANLACIEMNPWLSRVESLEKPDYLVIDLDPEDAPFEWVVEAALRVREVLDSVGAPSFPKTSGASGMHIYVPLAAQYTYEQSRLFANIIADLVHCRLPDKTSVLRPPARRPGRVYVDYPQNRWGATLAAPYCVRPRPGAPVSTPLTWDEVKPDLDPAQFTIRTILPRLEKLGDIFEPTLGPGFDLGAGLQRLKELSRRAA
ncbi:MAG: DNA ligase D [Armatimonadota bacterium]|nr:DNA ligase D [Armatimonadota bacterium]